MRKYWTAALTRSFLAVDQGPKMMPFKIAHQIGNSPMVDVAVGRLESPPLWVSAEVSPHVFMNLPLQVGPHRPERAHDHIAANTGVKRNVASGIFQPFVAGIIVRRHSDLLPPRFHDADAEGLLGRHPRSNQEHPSRKNRQSLHRQR